MKNKQYKRIGRSCIRDTTEKFPNIWVVFNNCGVGWNAGCMFLSREKARKHIRGGIDSVKYKILKYKQNFGKYL